MYTLLRENAQRIGGAPGLRHFNARAVNRTVLLLGLTSLFTDISSEMVSSVLPLYAIVTLGLSPLSFGVLDGIYQGASALVRLASGVVADRGGRYKEVAVAGYGLSALARVGLLLAGASWVVLGAVLLVDRTGKGIRSGPRDAMISLSTRPESLGMAFGVHRALDTFGALLGPILAFWLLSLAPDQFDVIFLVSLCAALIGVSILALFVPGQRTVAVASPAGQSHQPAIAQPQRDHEGVDATSRSALDSDVPAAPAISLRTALRAVRAPRVRRLVVMATLISLATVSDAFLYLLLRRQTGVAFSVFPLLFVATSVVYFVLAVPSGWLADRVGRGRVFVAGYGLLLVTYLVLIAPPIDGVSLMLPLLLLGTFYAATDGVLMALASAHIPAAVRASGLAALTTATSLARFGGSLLFGALWTWQGPQFALWGFAGGLLFAIILAAWVVRTPSEVTLHA